MDSFSVPGQSRSREANKPNWRLTLRHANKPKSELPGLWRDKPRWYAKYAKKTLCKIRANAEKEEEWPSRVSGVPEMQAKTRGGRFGALQPITDGEVIISIVKCLAIL
jgi:hypothetical protein